MFIETALQLFFFQYELIFIYFSRNYRLLKQSVHRKRNLSERNGERKISSSLNLSYSTNQRTILRSVTQTGMMTLLFPNTYIDDDFLKIMVDKTNQTYVHSNGKSLQLTSEEFKVWIGMVFVMSALQYPISQDKNVWEKDYRIPLISNAMTRDRFFYI